MAADLEFDTKRKATPFGCSRIDRMRNSILLLSGSVEPTASGAHPRRI